MNEGKINAPGSSNTGVTTTSGDEVNVEVVDGMIQYGKSFECLKCHKTIEQLTSDYRCPYCGRRYRKMIG